MSRQCAGERAQQRGLAAEQMGAAGDVEKESMRRIECDQRRKTVAPVGDVFQRLAVGGFVGVIHREFGTDGAGIGERQADREPGADGRFVDGIEQQRIVFLGDDDAGNVSLRLSRLRGRPYRIERCDTGGGSSLHTKV